VSDGMALYRLGATGVWERLPFVAGSGPAASRPTAGFNRMLYSLAPSGSILRYRADAQGLTSETWAAVEQYPDLAQARDIAIDERIHVLLADGTIETFREGLLESLSSPPVIPASSSGGFFAANGGSPVLYMVDPATTVGGAAGRVIRYVPGGEAQQFVAPNPGSLGGEAALAAAAIGSARQAAVVESLGQVFILSGDDLWVANIPAGPLI
ncbi:MAG: hypothetical protein ACR2J8_05785, partial [Thermomicrobiales bacterium]